MNGGLPFIAEAGAGSVLIVRRRYGEKTVYFDTVIAEI